MYALLLLLLGLLRRSRLRWLLLLGRGSCLRLLGLCLLLSWGDGRLTRLDLTLDLSRTLGRRRSSRSSGSSLRRGTAGLLLGLLLGLGVGLDLGHLGGAFLFLLLLLGLLELVAPAFPEGHGPSVGGDGDARDRGPRLVDR